MMLVRALALAAVLALTPAAGRAAAPALPPPWDSPLNREHPLVGQLVRTADGATVLPDRLVKAATDARFVLLGERHDNADHHRLQAWVLEAMVQAGRRPAVAFEMLDADQAGTLADYLAQPDADAAGLGPALGWTERGWPNWSLYRPIAATALAADLTLLPADVAQATQRAVGREGWRALPPGRPRALGLDRPLGDRLQQRLQAELKVAHCDRLPDSALPGMVRIQRLRDAVMADSLIAAAEAHDGAVLIAGRGHVRADRGVPWYLRHRLKDPQVLTLGIFEVQPGDNDPAAYLPAVPEGAAAAFDYVWFTPRRDDADPCAAFGVTDKDG